MSTTTLNASSEESNSMATAVFTACQNSHPFDERRIPLTQVCGNFPCGVDEGFGN